MANYYSYCPETFPIVLTTCIQDAKERYPEEKVQDVRMWTQKWPDISCGFSSGSELHIETLSPTVVIKFSHTLRLVYHNAELAYVLDGETTVRFYDSVRRRNLPGASDSEKEYLINGSE